MLGPPTFPGYEIIAEIGRGGMGVVYHARQISLRRDVAIKVMNVTTGPDDGEPRKRLRREVKILLTLEHPNLVKLYDADWDHDPPYMVFEHVPEARDLVKLLLRDPPGETRARALLYGMAQGLIHLHAAGVVHRDLKPANVLVDGRGTARVIDFGLSRLQDGNQTMLTAEGDTVGTLFYMAPEQMQSSEVDPRADVYSFGLIAYELLAGRFLFVPSGPDFVSPSARLEGAIPPLDRRVPGIDPALSRMVMRCLEADPARRLANLEQFVQGTGLTSSAAMPTREVPELRRATASMPNPTAPAPLDAPSSSSGPGRRPYVMIVTLALLVGLASGILLTPGSSPQGSSPSPASAGDHLAILEEIARQRSAAPEATLKELHDARFGRQGTPERFQGLQERWGLASLVRNMPPGALDGARVGGPDEVARRDAAFLSLEFLDDFAHWHKIPPLLGRPLAAGLSPGLGRRRLPEGEGWTYQILNLAASVREERPLTLEFEFKDVGRVAELVLYGAGYQLYPEFLFWCELNGHTFALRSTKTEPFDPSNPRELEDRREVLAAAEAGRFVLWSRPEDTWRELGIGLIARGLPATFLQDGINRLRVRVLDLMGSRHLEGPGLWRLGLARRDRPR